jgi:hypothetical protein
MQKNYFIAEIEKASRYAVPFLKNIDFLLNDRDRPSGMFQNTAEEIFADEERILRGNGLRIP